MSNFTEEDLIAYHLNELPRLRAASLRRALEHDTELAAESEAIAATLRAFRDAPTPAVDEAMLDRSWTRVRSSLAVLPEPPRKRWLLWSTITAGSLAAAVSVLLVALMLIPARSSQSPEQATLTPARSPLLTQASAVLNKLHGKRPAVHLVNDHSGPLTTEPIDAVATDPSMAAYLDSAERLLTEVSHEQAAPSEETRTQVHRMLLQNAVYQRTAQDRGDLAAADVMDDLGRVLVSLDAEPPHSERSADAFRIQMNIGSILFDLRILHHDPSPKAE